MRYFLLLLALVAGCATQQFWHEAPDMPLPEEIRIFTMPSVRAYCAGLRGGIIDPTEQRAPEPVIACTRCLGSSCTIYLSTEAASHCYLLHELTHAAGFNHPNFPETYAGCFFH